MPTPGSAVALVPARTMVSWAKLQARPGNTGVITVGGHLVASAGGIELLASDPLDVFPEADRNVHDLSEIWIDSDEAGDGVNYIYGVQL